MSSPFVDISRIYDIAEEKALSTLNKILRDAQISESEAGKVIAQTVLNLIQYSIQGAMQFSSTAIENKIKQIDLLNALTNYDLNLKQWQLNADRVRHEIAHIMAETENIEQKTALEKATTESQLLTMEKERLKIDKDIEISSYQALNALGQTQVSLLNARYLKPKLENEIKLTDAQVRQIEIQIPGVLADTEAKEAQAQLLKAQAKNEEYRTQEILTNVDIAKLSRVEILGRSMASLAQAETEKFNAQLTAERVNTEKEQTKLIKAQAAVQNQHIDTEYYNSLVAKNRITTEQINQIQMLNQAHLLHSQKILTSQQSETEKINTNLMTERLVTEQLNQTNIINQSRLTKRQGDTELVNKKIAEQRVETEQLNQIHISNQARLTKIQGDTEAMNTKLVEQRLVTEQLNQTNLLNQSRLTKRQGDTEVVNKRIAEQRLVSEQLNQTNLINQARLTKRQGDTEAINTKLTKTRLISEQLNQTNLINQARLTKRQGDTESINTKFVEQRLVTEQLNQTNIINQARLTKRQGDTELVNKKFAEQRVETEQLNQIHISNQAQLTKRQSDTEAVNKKLVEQRLVTEQLNQTNTINQARLTKRQGDTEAVNKKFAEQRLATEQMNQANILYQSLLTKKQGEYQSINTELTKHRINTEQLNQMQIVNQARLTKRQGDTEFFNTQLVQKRVTNEEDQHELNIQRKNLLIEQVKTQEQQTEEVKTRTSEISKNIEMLESRIKEVDMNTNLIESRLLVEYGIKVDANNTLVHYQDMEKYHLGLQMLKLKKDIEISDSQLALRQTELSNQIVNLGIAMSKASIESGFEPFSDANNIVFNGSKTHYLNTDLIWVEIKCSTGCNIGYVKKIGDQYHYFNVKKLEFEPVQKDPSSYKPIDGITVGELAEFFNDDYSINYAKLASFISSSFANQESIKESVLAYQKDAALAQVVSFDKSSKLRVAGMLKELYNNLVDNDIPPPSVLLSSILKLSEDITAPHIPHEKSDIKSRYGSVLTSTYLDISSSESVSNIAPSDVYKDLANRYKVDILASFGIVDSLLGTLKDGWKLNSISIKDIFGSGLKDRIFIPFIVDTNSSCCNATSADTRTFTLFLHNQPYYVYSSPKLYENKSVSNETNKYALTAYPFFPDSKHPCGSSNFLTKVFDDKNFYYRKLFNFDNFPELTRGLTEADREKYLDCSSPEKFVIYPKHYGVDDKGEINITNLHSDLINMFLYKSPELRISRDMIYKPLLSNDKNLMSVKNIDFNIYYFYKGSTDKFLTHINNNKNKIYFELNMTEFGQVYFKILQYSSNVDFSSIGNANFLTNFNNNQRSFEDLIANSKDEYFILNNSPVNASSGSSISSSISYFNSYDDIVKKL